MKMKASKEFVNLMAHWMIKHGPDGHCDGHKIIAKLAWQWMLDNPPQDKNTEINEDAFKGALDAFPNDEEDLHSFLQEYLRRAA